MKKVILIFIVLVSSLYATPVKEDRIEVRTPVDGSLVSASESLIVNSRVKRSIVAAAKFITVNEKSKNIVSASQELDITGDVENVVVSAARRIDISGDVEDSIIAACEFFRLSGDSNDVIVAARDVEINGDIQDLFVAGESVYISGTVRGNVYSSTDRVELVGDGQILGKIYFPEKKTELPSREIAKKGFNFIRILSIIHAFLGILVIGAVLKKSSPRLPEKLSHKFFEKWLSSFFIGLLFMLITPILILLTIPIFGTYSLGIMLGYFVLLILSKVFLVLAVSTRYNYLASILVVVLLSFFYPISFLFSVIGFGVFILFLKDELSGNPESGF